MSENSKPKLLTIILLIIGACAMLFLSYGCVLDWINKIETGKDWLVNLFYHPITGVISIFFFTLFVIFGIEKISPGRMEGIKNYLEEKKSVVLLFIVVTIISLILLIINSYILLGAGTSGVEGLVAFHTLTGVLFGVSLMILILKGFISRYLNNPRKWQYYIIICVIVNVSVFLAIVLIARAMGLLTI